MTNYKSAPLSEVMKQRASDAYVSPKEVSEKKEALMNAYKLLIQAQQHKAPPMIDMPAALGGSLALADSADPNVRAAGKFFGGNLQGKLDIFNKQIGAEQEQAKTFLNQNKTSYDLMMQDQDNELKYLNQAADADYRDDAARLRELAYMQKVAQSMPPQLQDNSAIARELGVPSYTATDPYANLDDVGKRQLRMNYEKQIDKYRDAVSEYEYPMQRMKRFAYLNEQAKDNLIGTGPIADYVPTFSAGLQEMDAIASELTPQMRTPGSGGTSDFDAQMFKKATVGTAKDHEVNKNIADAYVMSKQTQMDKADYLEAYLSANGHLRGADAAWKKYLNDNPIFSDEKFGLNQNRRDWKTYFSGGESSEVSGDVPEGIDPEDWKYLTEDERAVIRKNRGAK